MPESTLRPHEVFQKISFRPNDEEQKKLLMFEFQARRSQYVKDFLEESWLKEDLFENAANLQNAKRHKLHDSLSAELECSGLMPIFHDVFAYFGLLLFFFCVFCLAFLISMFKILRIRVQIFSGRVDMLWKNRTRTWRRLLEVKVRMSF